MYRFNSSDISHDALKNLQFTLSKSRKVSLDELAPELIRRLVLRYHYHSLIPADVEPFQDLLSLVRADYPDNRMRSLAQFSSTVLFGNIRWSAYKYAQLLEALHSPLTAYLVAATELQAMEGFSSNINENIVLTALKRIIQPNDGEANESSMLPFACRQFEQDIKASGSSIVFTDETDFKNTREFLHALNFLSIVLWKDIFALPNMESHLIFDFDDTGEAKELISVLDDDKRTAFLVQPGILEAILAGLSHAQRWILVSNNPDILVAYNECMKEVHGVELLELMGECPDNVDAVVIKNINALARSVVDQDETKSEGTSSDQDSESDDTPRSPNNELAMAPYSILSSMFPDEALSVAQETLSTNLWPLEDAEPELIRRLEMKFHYNQLIHEDNDTFQGLLILLRADDPKYRIRALKAPENQAMLQRINWSAYKYAQILDLCHSDTRTHLQADALLRDVDGFRGVTGFSRSNALYAIIRPNENEAYGLSMLEFACNQFEGEIELNGSSEVFTSWSDFPDQETFLHALNMISTNSWSSLFELPDMGHHLEFLFEDSEDAEELLDILDETQRIEFLMWPGVMRSIHDALRDEDRTELMESSPVFRVCYQEWLEENGINIEDALIQDTAEHIVSFFDLRNVLEITSNINHISYLSDPRLQEKLQSIHWSAFKYAALLAICERSSPCIETDIMLSTLPGFKAVSAELRQTALMGIIQSASEERIQALPKLILENCNILLYSCKVYSVDGDSAITSQANTLAYYHLIDTNTVFTHADDFPEISDLIAALDDIPLSHWPKIFALPEMETHVPLLLEGYVQFLDCRPIKSELNVLESLTIFKDENKLDAFLARPNVLEALLSGVAHEVRWKTLALNPQMREAFCERIGQGRGDKVLELLGDCPFKNETSAELGMSTIVLSAARRGYQQLNGTQGLSSGQCKQFHFFSPQTPHPFLEKLEKHIVTTKPHDLPVVRLR